MPLIRLWGGTFVGGLVGFNNCGISNCYAVGTVIGSNFGVGGLIGINGGGSAVSSCYATGTVTGNSQVGGLVGRHDDSSTVSNCYAIGAVSGNVDAGGLVGYNNGGNVSNSYWDVETSGQSNSDGGLGKTTAEMVQQTTFVDWDFATIWGIVENVTYPYLQSLYDPPPVVVSAVSYKTHGAAGEFGINVLDRTDDNDIECRMYGVTTLVVGFDIDIQGVGGLDPNDVSLSPSGSVDAVSLTAGNELTIKMSSTTNGEPLTVSFPGIANVDNESALCEEAICIRQLVGDVRPDGSINAIDRIDIRDAMGNPVDSSNFRADVQSDGSFGSIDRIDVRDAMGTGFVGVCP